MAQEMRWYHRLFEWLGSLTGIGGATFLALNMPWSGWGFVLFLVSNVFWITFAISRKYMGLLMMQLVFTLTSVIGIYRWFFV